MADEVTLLSVRGEAERIVEPDEASLRTTISHVADSKGAATAAVAASVDEVLAELAELGGQVLTAQSTRSRLTWSTHSVQTHEEYEHDKRTGTGGPTGRHRAAAMLLITVRDFTLLDAVGRVASSHDELDLHSVEWLVDDNNPEWAEVRAEAIQAALRKGRDYAAALNGAVVRVEHVADSGLLGGGSHTGFRQSAMATALRGGGEPDIVSLDPLPQVIDATIEARLAASIPPAL
jgi:uncharacterized protein YggE